MRSANDEPSRSEDLQEPTIVCRYSAQDCLLVRVRAPLPGLAASVAGGLSRLSEHLERQKLTPAGSPFVAYHELTPSVAEFELGLPVEGEPHGSQDMRVGSIPMGRYLTFAHTSGHKSLFDELHVMQRWLSRHAERTSGPLYAVVSQEEARTSDEPVILIQRRIIAGGAVAPTPDLVTSALTDDVLRAVATSIEEIAKLTPRVFPQLENLRPTDRSSYPPVLRSELLVKDAMTSHPHSCRPSDSAHSAARLMWEHDIGALPVVDSDGFPIAVVTDRDLCMAAYLEGKRLGDIPLRSAMSRQIFVCRPNDTLSAAERLMAKHQVRRLPVVGADGLLVGMLSMNDIVLARSRLSSTAQGASPSEVTDTLAAISQHRELAPPPSEGARNAG